MLQTFGIMLRKNSMKRQTYTWLFALIAAFSTLPGEALSIFKAKVFLGSAALYLEGLAGGPATMHHHVTGYFGLRLSTMDLNNLPDLGREAVALVSEGVAAGLGAKASIMIARALQGRTNHDNLALILPLLLGQVAANGAATYAIRQGLWQVCPRKHHANTKCVYCDRTTWALMFQRPSRWYARALSISRATGLPDELTCTLAFVPEVCSLIPYINRWFKVDHRDARGAMPAPAAPAYPHPVPAPAPVHHAPAPVPAPAPYVPPVTHPAAPAGPMPAQRRQHEQKVEIKNNKDHFNQARKTAQKAVDSAYLKLTSYAGLQDLKNLCKTLNDTKTTCLNEHQILAIRSACASRHRSDDQMSITDIDIMFKCRREIEDAFKWDLFQPLPQKIPINLIFPPHFPEESKDHATLQAIQARQTEQANEAAVHAQLALRDAYNSLSTNPGRKNLLELWTKIHEGIEASYFFNTQKLYMNASCKKILFNLDHTVQEPYDRTIIRNCCADIQEEFDKIGPHADRIAFNMHFLMPKTESAHEQSALQEESKNEAEQRQRLKRHHTRARDSYQKFYNEANNKTKSAFSYILQQLRLKIENAPSLNAQLRAIDEMVGNYKNYLSTTQQKDKEIDHDKIQERLDTISRFYDKHNLMKRFGNNLPPKLYGFDLVIPNQLHEQSDQDRIALDDAALKCLRNVTEFRDVLDDILTVDHNIQENSIFIKPLIKKLPMRLRILPDQWPAVQASPTVTGKLETLANLAQNYNDTAEQLTQIRALIRELFGDAP